MEDTQSGHRELLQREWDHSAVCVVGCSLVYLSPGLFLPGDGLESAKEQEKTEFSGLGVLQKAGGSTMTRLSLQEILRRAPQG